MARVEQHHGFQQPTDYIWLYGYMAYVLRGYKDHLPPLGVACGRFQGAGRFFAGRSQV